MIKICGIKHPEHAKEAIKFGANWIGIIFHPDSKRCVDIKTGKEIAKIARENGGIPVAIFVNHSAQEMLSVCQKTGIEMIQLHGNKSREEHIQLPRSYQRIYTYSVLTPYSEDNGCDPTKDFLLFDCQEPGSGKTFDWDNFSYQGKFRWLLAGGLTSKNVKKGISKLNPFGVDVSTGVENLKNEKDLKKIQKFISVVL